MWWELIIFLVGALTFLGVCYVIFTQRELIAEKDREIIQLQQTLTTEMNLQKDLVKDALTAKNESLNSFRDRETLIRIQKIVWDSRDTTAAENCVKRLIASGTSVNQISVTDCYNQLREDLGLSGWDALDL